jgi:hypothetical protein
MRIGGAKKRRARAPAKEDEEYAPESSEGEESDEEVEQGEAALVASRQEAIDKPRRRRQCLLTTMKTIEEERPEDALEAYKDENLWLISDYNKLQERYDKLVDEQRQRGKGGGPKAQDWMVSDWSPLLPELPTPDAQVAALHRTLMQAKAQLVGRDEVLSQIAAMVHTFAYNHRAFNSTYLNFALLGPPGTGKTTIARTIGMIFQQLGIVLSKKFDIVAREDLVGGVIGETATKTRGVLNDHLEGTLMIDEAYALAAGQFSNGRDPYGVEAIDTMVGFLDKNQGQIVLLVAGYADRMQLDFFGVNPGLPRRFPYQFTLRPFESEQLMTIFLSQFLGKMSDADRTQLLDNRTWSYTLQTIRALNDNAYLPNQGGDIENIAAAAVIAFSTNVKGQSVGAGLKQMSPCDMQAVFQQFLFTSEGEVILPGNVALNHECQSDSPTCVAGPGVVCLPQNDRIEALAQQRRRDRAARLKQERSDDPELNPQDPLEISVVKVKPEALSPRRRPGRTSPSPPLRPQGRPASPRRRVSPART